jgi:hypothetical protein
MVSRVEIFTAMETYIVVIWVMTSSLVGRYQFQKKLSPPVPP